MPFPIEISFPIEAGEVRGKQEPVAVDCWFTCSGKAIPRMIKYMDQGGEIYKIDGLRVITSADKTYTGNAVREVYCQAAYAGRKYTFRLLYYKSKNKWTITWI